MSLKPKKKAQAPITSPTLFALTSRHIPMYRERSPYFPKQLHRLDVYETGKNLEHYWGYISLRNPRPNVLTDAHKSAKVSAQFELWLHKGRKTRSKTDFEIL